MNWSWMSAVAFVAATGLAGLSAGHSSRESSHPPRRLFVVTAAIVLPSALLAALLFGS